MQNEINTIETAAVASDVQPTTAAEIAAASQAKPIKLRKPRAAKPAVVAEPTVEAPAAKPVSEAKQANDAARAERQAIIDASRDTAALYYTGASIAAHRAKPSPRQLYIDRCTNPAQRASGGILTARDESGLALALSRTDKSGSFDPVACGFDVGILSRLASVDHITFNADSDTFRLSDKAVKLARAVVSRHKRAAAAA